MSPSFRGHRRVVIVGAGAAGAAAALGLSNRGTLMLDVGTLPKESRLPPEVPIDELRTRSKSSRSVRLLDECLIGQDFESVVQPTDKPVSIKLKPPLIRYVTDRPKEAPTDTFDGCDFVQSFALGGLANAWGAGAMRYTDLELREFPYPRREIERSFDDLTQHIGISGSCDDELVEYFGSTNGLLPQLALSELGIRLLERYHGRSRTLKRKGFRIGRPRLAVLSVDHAGRRRFTGSGQEFFVAPHEGIYSPAFTIAELRRKSLLDYIGGILVQRFSNLPHGVMIHGIELATGLPVQWSADTLILAAGTLNTTRIVLASRGDTESRLPILDNPVSFIPLLDAMRIGVPLKTPVFSGAELTVIGESRTGGFPVQGSIYCLAGPLRTDLLREFPLLAGGNLTATRHLLPAMLMLQLFYPDSPRPGNSISLRHDGGIKISFGSSTERYADAELVKYFRGLGYLTSSRLCRQPIPGSSVHYAGSIPARIRPSMAYETDADCRLGWADRVVIADASTFPLLPAKNHTLMLMANAHRLGRAAALVQD